MAVCCLPKRCAGYTVDTSVEDGAGVDRGAVFAFIILRDFFSGLQPRALSGDATRRAMTATSVQNGCYETSRLWSSCCSARCSRVRSSLPRSRVRAFPWLSQNSESSRLRSFWPRKPAPTFLKKAAMLSMPRSRPTPSWVRPSVNSDPELRKSLRARRQALPIRPGR